MVIDRILLRRKRLASTMDNTKVLRESMTIKLADLPKREKDSECC